MRVAIVVGGAYPVFIFECKTSINGTRPGEGEAEAEALSRSLAGNFDVQMGGLQTLDKWRRTCFDPGA